MPADGAPSGRRSSGHDSGGCASPERPATTTPATCARVQKLRTRPGSLLLGSGKLATGLDRLDLIDEYKFLVLPRIAGHGPTLYQSGLPSTRRLELVSATPLRSGAVAMHHRRARRLDSRTPVRAGAAVACASLTVPALAIGPVSPRSGSSARHFHEHKLTS